MAANLYVTPQDPVHVLVFSKVPVLVADCMRSHNPPTILRKLLPPTIEPALFRNFPFK